MRSEAEQILRALVGRDDAALRDDQWAAIEALVVDRRRALVVQRTGWGKSAVYFVATALLRARGAGPTLIVSPLLALMRNQIDAAARAGITAHTINSSNTDEWDAVEAALATSSVDVLLISPERLNNPDFRDRVLPGLAARIGLLVVDEAHCVSDWGHDFRPDYRRIRDALARLPADVPVLATTATANQRVVTDVADQLAVGPDGVTFDVLVQRGTLERESLRLGVLRLPNPEDQLGWLVEHLDDLPGSGIIYTLTVAATEDVAALLKGAGHEVVAYSGRTDTAERLDAEAALVANRVKAVVATSALGMGFDKPDLGFVVHVGAPQSPIAYYQQVGRAGRAVERADVLLLPGREDEAIWRYFGSLAFPDEDVVRVALAALDRTRPMSTASLETKVELRRARLEMMLKVLDVDGAVRRVQGGWLSTGEPWTYDRERYARVAAARDHEQQAMRRYLAGGSCRMEMLRHELDDPGAVACGRCDVCAGTWFPTEVSEGAAATARAAIDRPGIDLEERTTWPTGMPGLGVDVKGRIAEGDRALPGRAVARLSDIGWGTRLRELLGPGSSDAAANQRVLGAVVAVLKAWGWADRPVAVVAMPSRSRPRLIASVAEGIATLGKLPLLGSMAYEHGGPTGSTRWQQRPPPRCGVGSRRGAGRRRRRPGRPRRTGAARRRPRRLPLDHHRRRPRPAPGGRRRGAAVRPRPRRLSTPPQEGQSLWRRTSDTWWSRSLRRISEARSRVGRMFSLRLRPLMLAQMPSAVARACSGVERGEVAEEAVGVLEHRLAQGEEPLHVPLPDVHLVGVDVDREVEVVADELGLLGRHLEHVEALEDEDVGPPHDRLLALDDVVHDVAVDRRPHLVGAALEVAEELQQAAGVVGLGEALAVHRPRSASTAFGNRNPSVVTRSTCGWSGHRASRACRMRANVLLPTATLPATPMTYGTRGAIVPRNVDDTRARSCDALT